jgi:hypothetical protein
MADRPLTVKLLEFCEPGELVKIDARWALVGQTPTGLCLVFLSGDNAPLRVDISDKQKTTRSISFGKGFKVLPDYVSECNMAPRFERGSLYYASSDGRGNETTPYLAVGASNEGKAFFLNLESFTYGDAPGHVRRYSFCKNASGVRSTKNELARGVLHFLGLAGAGAVRQSRCR